MDYKYIEYILQIIAAGIGTLGFSIVFHAPRRELFFCAMNGAITWLVYLLMTEFGAGAIPGVNTFEAQRWSEDYQADYLEFTLNQLLSNAKISGTYIWQYCDSHIPFGRELARPRSFNNKGIVDEYRRPKRAYRVVQKIYGNELGEGAHFDRARINNYTLPEWK